MNNQDNNNPTNQPKSDVSTPHTQKLDESDNPDLARDTDVPNKLEAEIDELLEGLHRPNPRPTYPGQNKKRRDEARAKLLSMFREREAINKQKQVTKQKSFCGCPMCTFHTKAWQLQKEGQS